MDARHLVMDGRSGHLDKGTQEQRPEETGGSVMQVSGGKSRE